MLTLGIDLASLATNTAACKIEWGDGHATPALPMLGVTDRDVLTQAAGCDVIGIDAPFGWPQLVERFAVAVAELDRRLASDPLRFVDDNQDAEVRAWLDGAGPPLAWAGPGVTVDEWFFVTTLYGEMTLDGQRTHIRTFFPRFVQEAKRDIRTFTPDLVANWKLRSGWMKSRLCRMANLLRERRWTMTEYVEHLRTLEHRASPTEPMPALDAIVRDHKATGWKTLSVFVRDCVGGNCFPIDSRVDKELRHHGLPSDERLLVSLSLRLGRNPRQVARMFYAAGGD